MSSATVIAIDAGTTGITTVLFDSDLSVLARSYREFGQSFPRPGWVEHEAAAIFQALEETLSEVCSHPRAAAAGALGITNQRETVFAVDRSSKTPLLPGIVWQDRRTEDRCAELRSQGRASEIRRKTGLPIDPYFSATKVEWMLRHGSLAGKAATGEVLFGTVDALILSYLTGGRAWATDLTNASRTMLFDIHERRWDEELCALFGVRTEWLPEVLPSAGGFGVSLPERTGGLALPIRGVAGDQQAALFGQECWHPGSSKATYGTGSFLLLNTGRECFESEDGLVSTLAVGPRGESVYALEGSVFVCGALVQWLRDQLGLFEHASEIEELASTVPDSGGVTIVPAFVGLGAPYWDAGARGAILGLTRGVSKGHLARAALEAIAFQNAELLDVFRRTSGLEIESLLADGGAARNDLLMQLQADLGAVVVRRPADVEATARGAAALAGLGAELWEGSHPPQRASVAVREFAPQVSEEDRTQRMAVWRSAVSRVRTA